MARLDLNGVPITPTVIAMVVSMLERDGCIEVVNGHRTEMVGVAPMALGRMLEKIANSEIR